MKQKILFLTPVFDQGGTETYILELSKYLNENNYDVCVISAGGLREKELESNNIKHIKINNIKRKNIILIWKNILDLKSIIESKKIDIIHTSSIYTLILAKIAIFLLFNKKVKHIYTMHGGPNKTVEKTNRIILNRFVDKIIVLSNITKQLLVKNGVNENKICVVYNGIKNINENSNFNFKRKDDKVIITTCGRLTEQKGQEYLIDAVSKLKIDNFEVWIIGEGELKEKLESKIEYYKLQDKVKLLGFKENVTNYLAKSDIFVLPSLWEQFPISVLEAMMMKLPIIATNVNGLPEEIGESGLLVNPKSPEELRKNIFELIIDENKRNKLGENAYNRFENNFTIKNMGEQTIRVYEECHR